MSTGTLYANPSTMEWDADANRVSFTSSTGGTTEFVYDTTAGIPAVIEEVTPSGSVYYIREPNGALIARVVGTVLDATTTRYYHFDALGSTRKLTDKDGVVTDTYSYDAWGNTTHTGSTEQPYQYVGQLGYYTHYQDEHLDLLQLGVRFYDPETGRFTQRDPAKDGLNWYGYAGGNPIANIDPWGLAWYDGWLSGEWGDRIPGLGRLWYDWGYTVGLRDGGYASTGDVWKAGLKAGGWTVASAAGGTWLAVKAAGFLSAAWQGVSGSAYMIGSFANGLLADNAAAAGAAFLNILPRLPTAYSWTANRLWLWLILHRPGTAIHFYTDPASAQNTFPREMEMLRQLGCPF